jgi:hypothetical protein
MPHFYSSLESSPAALPLRFRAAHRARPRLCCIVHTSLLLTFAGSSLLFGTGCDTIGGANALANALPKVTLRGPDFRHQIGIPADVDIFRPQPRRLLALSGHL